MEGKQILKLEVVVTYSKTNVILCPSIW